MMTSGSLIGSDRAHLGCSELSMLTQRRDFLYILPSREGNEARQVNDEWYGRWLFEVVLTATWR